MNEKRIGTRTIALRHPPSVLSCAAVGGKMESEGPLAAYFDELGQDSFFGEKTWEKAESAMQKKALQMDILVVIQLLLLMVLVLLELLKFLKLL